MQTYSQVFGLKRFLSAFGMTARLRLIGESAKAAQLPLLTPLPVFFLGYKDLNNDNLPNKHYLSQLGCKFVVSFF